MNQRTQIFVGITLIAVVGIGAWFGLGRSDPSSIPDSGGPLEEALVSSDRHPTTASTDPAESTASNQVQSASETPAVPQREPRPREATVGRPHLPSEDAFLTDGGMQVDAAAALMGRDDFDTFLDRVDAEGYSDPQVADLVSLYEMAFDQATKAVPDVAVRRMSCGRKICFLATSAPSIKTFDTWLRDFLKNPTAKKYAVGRDVFINELGIVEYRMVFTTDPDHAAGVMAPDPTLTIEMQREMLRRLDENGE